MDHYNAKHLYKLWNNYIIDLNLKKLDITLYNSIHHDIKYVCVDKIQLPKGGLIDSAQNYYVTNYNTLHTECKSMNCS